MNERGVIKWSEIIFTHEFDLTRLIVCHLPLTHIFPSTIMLLNVFMYSDLYINDCKADAKGL